MQLVRLVIIKDSAGGTLKISNFMVESSLAPSLSMMFVHRCVKRTKPCFKSSIQCMVKTTSYPSKATGSAAPKRHRYQITCFQLITHGIVTSPIDY